MTDATDILLNEIKLLRRDVISTTHELQNLRRVVDELKPVASKFISVKEMAGQLGYSTRHIRSLCETGFIEGIQPSKDGGEWKIFGTELQRIRKEAEENRFNKKTINHRKRIAA